MKSNEKGQGLFEYALIVVFVAILLIVAIQAFHPHLGNIYSTIIDALTPT